MRELYGRPCKGVESALSGKSENYSRKEVTGVFVGFGTDFMELTEGVGQITTAIVEDADGVLRECFANGLHFIIREDYAAQIIQKIAESLPNTPGRIWSEDGDEILTENKQLAESIADLFDAIYGEQTVNTGYYDPEEDGRDGETDERTGYWYVTTI